MINLLDKFLTLLIDVIHSMVWAFKNNYLFEAWRNIGWGGFYTQGVSSKSILCDDINNHVRNHNTFGNRILQIEKAKQASAMIAALNEAATKKIEAIKPVSGFKEHVRREKAITQKYTFYCGLQSFGVIARELQGTVAAHQPEERPSFLSMMGGALGALL